MADLLDRLYLTHRASKGVPVDDRLFRRHDGSGRSVIYFLPWNTPLAWARWAGLLPLDYLACYELPRATVSPDPTECVSACASLVDDAAGLVARAGVHTADLLLIGLSAGSFAATALANRVGCRLCSVTSADRADLLLWQSRAVRAEREEAERRGFGLEDFTRKMWCYHPINNLSHLAPGSAFVFGTRDDGFVPSARWQALARAVERRLGRVRIECFRTGHIGALRASRAVQLAMAKTSPAGQEVRTSALPEPLVLTAR